MGFLLHLTPCRIIIHRGQMEKQECLLSHGEGLLTGALPLCKFLNHAGDTLSVLYLDSSTRETRAIAGTDETILFKPFITATDSYSVRSHPLRTEMRPNVRLNYAKRPTPKIDVDGRIQRI